MLYYGQATNGRYGLLMNGEIVKIRYASEPDEKNPKDQTIYFTDSYNQAMWAYSYQFIKFSDSKIKLKKYYKGLQSNRRY